MALPTVQPLPQAPSSADPANFDARADEFLPALNTYGQELNAFGLGINEVEQNVTSLHAQTRDIAAIAQAQQAAAVSIVQAQPFIPSKTYLANEAAISNVNKLAYRRKSAGQNSADPANDSSLETSNWTIVGVPPIVRLKVSGAVNVQPNLQYEVIGNATLNINIADFADNAYFGVFKTGNFTVTITGAGKVNTETSPDGAWALDDIVSPWYFQHVGGSVGFLASGG